MEKGSSFKIDLHCHSHYSGDGVSKPEEIVERARAQGLDGVAITDHNTCECVDYFRQKGLIREDGLPVDGFLIVPGQEISTAEGHLLALGITLPNLKGISALEAVSMIHAKGGIAVAPHPYDYFRAGIRESVLETLPLDGIEVFNAATAIRKCNQQSREYALRRQLPMTAGSDAHLPQAVGVSYTILDVDERSVAGVLKAIPKGPQVVENYLTFRESMRKTFHNLFRLKRKIRSA
ncbi:MAG: PHP domain-containing protein [Verrucomicrobiota bacterium]